MTTPTMKPSKFSIASVSNGLCKYLCQKCGADNTVEARNDGFFYPPMHCWNCLKEYRNNNQAIVNKES